MVDLSIGNGIINQQTSLGGHHLVGVDVKNTHSGCFRAAETLFVRLWAWYAAALSQDAQSLPPSEHRVHMCMYMFNHVHRCVSINCSIVIHTRIE